MKRRKWIKFSMLLVLALLAGAGAGVARLLGDLPDPEDIPNRLNAPSVRLTDRSGVILYEALPENGGRHLAVPFTSIPLACRQATIATEDRSFYTNPGIDPAGILRAVWTGLRSGEAQVGGSTITQQVARNLLLSQVERGERTLQRKLREMALAWQLTRRLPKDDILALYLNQTYYGGLAYGIEAAAQTYFAKPVSDLDLAECALLAGLPQAPALYNPFTDWEAAKTRQSTVLGLMVRAGLLKADERRLAEREPLALAGTPYPMLAPHFVMLALDRLDELLSQEEIYAAGGIVVRTTLDMAWQGHAEEAVRRQVAALQRSEAGLGHNLNSAALVALEPGTGLVMAMVGSPDYFDAEHGGAINMALAPRQPGSALKPIVYAAALDPSRPDPWSAATMILDVRTAFTTSDGRAYIPANYDSLEHGPVLLREALASSLNIPAVVTLEKVGLEDLFALAGRLGISTLHNPERYDLSLALGGGEVRLLELTAAYAAFANSGLRVDPVVILDITGSQGQELYTLPPATGMRVLDERVAWLISDILSDNEARLVGFGSNSALRIDRPAAVKTGTTSNFHDNWTIGYTPDLVVGVWAGNTDYQPMRDVNGLTGAAPIWHTFLRRALAGTSPEAFHRPAGLVQVEICARSGLLPSPDCPYRYLEWFIEGTQPSRPDELYRRVTVDAATGRLAGENTPDGRRQPVIALNLPPEAHEWARREGLPLLSDLAMIPAAGQAQADAASGSGLGMPLRLLSPAPNSVYRRSAGFSSQAQQVRVAADAAAGLDEVQLWVDGEILATLNSPPYEAWWPLAEGSHEAWAEARTLDGTLLISERVTFKVEPHR